MDCPVLHYLAIGRLFCGPVVRSVNREGDDVVTALEVDLGVTARADHDVLLAVHRVGGGRRIHAGTGEANGWFRAYDAASGKVLWSFQAGAGVNAPASSYSVDGKQYIVVGAGGNTQIDFKRGNNIIAFTVD